VDRIADLKTLLSVAMALGAGDVAGWSSEEKRVIKELDVENLGAPPERIREDIKSGRDPLGDLFCSMHAPADRRSLGQTYTPSWVVSSMVDWAFEYGKPARIVDPGVGSGRYLVAAGRRWDTVPLIGAEIDPVAAILARGHLAAAGLADRASVELIDYRSIKLPEIDSPTLFIGNPPYVRHHQIAPEWKKWLLAQAEKRGLSASGLAGLHVYFFLATAQLGRPGDFGAFVTSAEWLDVNYGRLVRELLLDGLGGQSVHVLEPTIEVFPDAITTAAITCFEVGSRPSSLRLRQVKKADDLGVLSGGRKVARERLTEATRWGPLIRVMPKLPTGYIELGELCRVHRGQVTGSNATWVVQRGATQLPERVLFPSVTRARELFAAGNRLTDGQSLRLVVDLPSDLDGLSAEERQAVDEFLRRAKENGAAEGFVARNRRAWWRVGLRPAAPILATYMARRPPAFVRNEADARHINIAHGLYPRDTLPCVVLDRLADYLRRSVDLGQGRTYAGGLTKFEPREMERLAVPAPEVLLADATSDAALLD
jgi:adenine-specific DNA-methyltransferase